MKFTDREPQANTEFRIVEEWLGSECMDLLDDPALIRPEVKRGFYEHEGQAYTFMGEMGGIDYFVTGRIYLLL